MIDHCVIFTSGGVVLWSKSISALRGDPISAFIQRVVLEGRVKGLREFLSGPHRVHWLQHSAFDLFFVAITPSALQLPYIDGLLEATRDKFVGLFRTLLSGAHYLDAPLPLKFDKTFSLLLDAAASRVRAPPKPIADPTPAALSPSPLEAPPAASAPEANTEALSAPDGPDDAPEPGRRAGPRQFAGGKGQKKKPKTQNATEKVDVGGRDPDAFGRGQRTDLDDWAHFGLRAGAAEAEDESAEAASLAAAAGAPGGSWGALGRLFSGLANRTLTEADLLPATQQFRDALIAKNVARDVADVLCASVRERMVGRTLSSFARVRTAVREALADALTVILTPAREIDMLVLAREVREREGRPLVVVFCGVNGVGKSTNLGKVTSWLQQNGLRVMIAACDTFRSGAVEQLRVHADNLGATLFHQGYAREPAEVARQAVYVAQQEGIDVVLIDTAGRMQDNVPLMKSLVRLISVNTPDLIFFVGEALVGNEAVSQLTKYNEFLEHGAGRGIDGIILTKFDTIDDKMGAAISMVHTTGRPIVFVGTGQNYPDLKKLNIPTVVSALLQ